MLLPCVSTLSGDCLLTSLGGSLLTDAPTPFVMTWKVLLRCVHHRRLAARRSAPQERSRDRHPIWQRTSTIPLAAGAARSPTLLAGLLGSRSTRAARLWHTRRPRRLPFPAQQERGHAEIPPGRRVAGFDSDGLAVCRHGLLVPPDGI